MRWKIFLLFGVFHILSTVNCSSLGFQSRSSLTSRMVDNFTCYNSSDPAAQNASLLYDDLSLSGHLWNRDDLQKPLPPCSAIGDRLSDHTCEVCRDKEVFVVCQNLSESVDLRMEGSRPIRISRCECDQLTNKAEIPTAAPTASPTTAPTSALSTALTPAGNKLRWPVPTAVFILFIIFVAVLFGRHQCKRRQSEDKQNPDVAVEMKPLNGEKLKDVVTDSEFLNGHH